MRLPQRILCFQAIMAAVADDEAVQTEFATYEDYLDSQIKPEDMFYLNVRQFFEHKCVFLEI